MLQRIETSEVMRRAMKLFDEHNAQCPIKEVVSRRQQGDILVKRRVGLIPESLTTTFHTLLTQYVHDYNRTCSIMPAGMYTMQDLPPMHTTRKQLAKYCRCSEKTIYNHIVRLRDFKLLTTKFHGDKKAFELWISPKILFSAGQLAASESLQNTPEIALQGENVKNLPHSSTHREIFEKEKKNADKLINQLGSICDGKNNQGQKGRAETAEQPFLDVQDQRREDQTGGGGAAEKSEIVARNDQERRKRATAMLEARMPAMPKGLDHKYWEMLFNFWFYAWKVIYPKREFTKQQQEKAVIAIAKGVFNNFVDKMSDQEWTDYYQHQLRKVDKAGRHYDNHPDAYKPDPYAVVVPGKGYFDYENVKGFVGVDAWIKKDLMRNFRKRQDYAEKQEAKMKRCEALLRTARRDFEKLRQNIKPRKEVDGKNKIALFQYYHVIFTGMGKKWEDAFAQQYLDQQARDFKPPVYTKPIRQRKIADRVLMPDVPATIVDLDDLEMRGLYDGDGYEILY